MGKKGGKSKGFISQGLHSNVNPRVKNAMRREYMQSADRILNQMAALRKGRDVVMTIENPNKEQTNKKFIRIRLSGREYLQALKDNSRIQKTVDA